MINHYNTLMYPFIMTTSLYSMHLSIVFWGGNSGFTPQCMILQSGLHAHS